LAIIFNKNKKDLLGLETKADEYPIPPWRALAFLHPKEEIQGLIDLPQG
jgi:hypothetical protein